MSAPAPAAPLGLRLPATIDRLPFVALGLGLFVLKYATDYSVARGVFGRGWEPWDYLVTSVPFSALAGLSRDAAFHLTLLAIAVPFIVVGVALTVARLRAAGLPVALAILFFLPVLNLLLFLVLAVTPSTPRPVAPRMRAEDGGGDPAVPPRGTAAPPVPLLAYGRDAAPDGFRARWPESRRASLWTAALLPVPFGLVMTYLAVNVFSDYGWGVFVALPFTQGVLAAALHGARQRRSIGESTAVAMLCGMFTMVAMFTFALEGIGCLFMLLPLALPVMAIGGAVGHALQVGGDPANERGATYLSLAAVVPLFMAAEHVGRPAAPVYAVTTCVDVDAPPAEVWRHVTAFGRIDPPGDEDWLFRAGVAYPVEATIDGSGVGAVRRCVFSTGPFVEPITAWDEPRLLKFDVTDNPPAMREWSPYGIHPPHVDDFLVSHGGQFHLVPLDGGRRTRLEGTTWYEHNLWPAGYWRLWSDFIIHRIHGRVLTHVKALAEANNSQTISGRAHSHGR